MKIIQIETEQDRLYAFEKDGAVMTAYSNNQYLRRGAIYRGEEAAEAVERFRNSLYRISEFHYDLQGEQIFQTEYTPIHSLRVDVDNLLHTLEVKV